ncbi:hypothetical protein FA95DRAFT_1604326 [Auriscalpium vulgare]|uniref:Uncharacterized protein n=1 Tax=Auriscalpium vulgare TaxID=40419 RepID=A0ACB8RZG1_9AGAM|nr:hypothetical protein FA95DRAFT_1604326 [Auriscalpium vulgare]
MGTSPVAFVIGAGNVIGQAVGSTLKDEGYQVALGSRTGANFGDGFLSVKIDVLEPATVAAAFDEVTRHLGPPAVVVFNREWCSSMIPRRHALDGFSFKAVSFEHIPTEDDPLSLPREAFEKHLALGTAVFDAARHALAGFRKLDPGGAGSPRSFIVTGNIAPFWVPKAKYLTIQLQKVIAAYLTELFAGSYRTEGVQWVFHKIDESIYCDADDVVRFYFALQVTAQGGPPESELSGEAHAIAYKRILENSSQGEWDVWFVADGSPYTGDKPGLP